MAGDPVTLNFNHNDNYIGYFTTWNTYPEAEMNFGSILKIRSKKKELPGPLDEETEADFAAINAILAKYADPGDRYAYDLLRSKVLAIEAKRARAKAEELLLSHLSDKQRKSYERKKTFEVRGKTFTYEIDLSESRRFSMGSPRITIVRGLVSDKAPLYLCTYVQQRDLPIADQALAAKLYIEANEKGFLQTANPESRSEWYFTPDGKKIARYTGKPLVDGGHLVNPDWFQTFQAHQATFNGLREQLAALGATQATVNRNYVDATTFGDTNRTYLAGNLQGVTFTNDNGDTVGQYVVQPDGHFETVTTTNTQP